MKLHRATRLLSALALGAALIGGTVVVLPTAAQAADPVPSAEVTGELVVTVSDPDPAIGGTSEVTYELVTADGARAELTGDIGGGARSGDAFRGTVTVPDEILAEIDDPSVRDALDAATADEPATGAEVSDAVIAASEESEDALVARDSQVIPGWTKPEPGTAAAPVAHQIYVLVAADTLSQAHALISPSGVTSLIGQMSAFFARETDGQISAMNIAQTQYRAGNGDDWDWAASVFGQSESFFQNSNGRHLVILVPGGGGLGNVGNQLHYGGILWSGVSGYEPNNPNSEPVSTLAHELGHNISFGHANLAVCSGAVTDACTDIDEYGDYYSVMGGPAPANPGDNTLRELNPQHLYDLGVLDDTEVTTVQLTYPATSGTFNVQLNAAGEPTRRALRIVEPGTRNEYFVDLRTGTGSDANAYYTRPSAASSGVSLGTGVRVMEQWQYSSIDTVLLPVNSDASLTTGQVFVNDDGSVKLTVSSVAATSAQIKVELAGTTYPDITPVYRFWSENRKSHFFTSSLSERDYVIANYDDRDWLYEGEAWQAFGGEGNPGTIPVYRFWSQTFQGHFYTADPAERDAVINNYDDLVWKYEGPAYWVYPFDPDDYEADVDYVYRFWSQQNRHHFYTASYDEAMFVAFNYDWYVWAFEGEQFSVPRS